MRDNNKLLKVSSCGLALLLKSSRRSTIEDNSGTTIVTYQWVTVDDIDYCIYFYTDLINPINRFSSVDVYEWDSTNGQLLCLTVDNRLDYKSVLRTLNNRRRS